MVHMQNIPTTKGHSRERAAHNASEPNVIYQNSREMTQQEHIKTTVAPSINETDPNASRLDKSGHSNGRPHKSSTVKFGKMNQVIDLTKDGQVSYERQVGRERDEKKPSLPRRS